MGGDKEFNIPDQKELEKELAEYLSKKYGDRVRIVSPVVLPESNVENSASKGSTTGIDVIANFSIRPTELESYLDEYIIRQDDAKAILATKICTHFNRIKYLIEQKRDAVSDVGQIKNNIIMIGPTGVGKTYMIKLIAKKLRVPFIKGDATKFSETGYVGGDVEDLIRDLVQEADGDIESAQFGIVYIDEIDKIASSGHFWGPDVSRTGVQRALLKPMEETEIDLKIPHDPIAQLEAIERYRKTGKREKRTVSTKNILFIVSGAFSSLPEIIKKRVSDQAMGFGAAISSKDEQTDYLRYVKAEDLIEYGFESEFVGRLPVVAVFSALEAKDLYEILKNPNCPVMRSKKRDFKAYGIDITFEDQALHLIAEKAYREKTGARGLARVVEKILLGFEKTLPSTSIRYLTITPELVKDPEGTLKDFVDHSNETMYLERFEKAREKELDAIKDIISKRQAEILGNIAFTPFRLRCVAESCLNKDIDVRAAGEDLLSSIEQVKGYEAAFLDKYGIKIIFGEDAVDAIIDKAGREGTSTYVFCNKLTDSYRYALRMIQDKTGQNVFYLPSEAILESEGYISRLIKESFKDALKSQGSYAATKRDIS